MITSWGRYHLVTRNLGARWLFSSLVSADSPLRSSPRRGARRATVLRVRTQHRSSVAMGGAFSKPDPSPPAVRPGAGTFDDIQKSFSDAKRGAGREEPAPAPAPAPRARRRWRFSIFGPSRRRQETSLAGKPQKPPKPLKEGGSLAMRAREVRWP